jgi:hypothetical protein
MLRERAREKVKGLEFAVTQTAFADSRAELEEELYLARIALASLEAEPVHQVLNGDAWVDLSKGAMESQKRVGAIVRTVYTAPPAPASVPDAYIRDGRGRMMLNGRQEPRIGYSAGWNACRAAMLQGAEPVTTACKLPDDFDFDRFNDVVWLEAVASNPHMHSPTTSTIAMVALELNRKLADGNSPVIPDGWVMVPVEPTAEMISSGIAAHYERNQIQIHDRPSLGPIECAYVAMVAAAPQQEVK